VSTGRRGRAVGSACRHRRWFCAAAIAVALVSTTTAPAHADDPSLVPASAVTAASYGPHWSGYSRTDGRFTAVRGAFVVPTVRSTCGMRSAAAVFVGLGGLGRGSNRFVQAGFTLTPNARGLHGAWYELFGETESPPPVNVPFDARVGDSVAVRIVYVAAADELRFTWRNRTTRVSVTRVVPDGSTWMPRGRHAVADWITERPNYPDVGSPMADTTVRWSGLWAERHGQRYGLAAKVMSHTATGVAGRVVAAPTTARPRAHAFTTRWRSCT
jgi:hypothetical protein